MLLLVREKFEKSHTQVESSVFFTVFCFCLSLRDVAAVSIIKTQGETPSYPVKHCILFLRHTHSFGTGSLVVVVVGHSSMVILSFVVIQEALSS